MSDPAINPNTIAFGRLAAVEWQVKCLARAVVALGPDTRKLKHDLGNSRFRATDPEFISAFETSTAGLRPPSILPKHSGPARSTACISTRLTVPLAGQQAPGSTG